MKMIGVLLCFGVLLSACEPAKQFLELLGLSRVEKPNVAPDEVKKETELASQTPDPSEKAASIAKENSELLSEVYKVVFNQDEIDDKLDFGSLAHSLNQGASLEGIYRGLVMGSRYRALESKSQGASPAELKVFAEEMAELQGSMRNPSVFSSTEAKKAPSIEYPDGSSPIPTSEAGSQTLTKRKEHAEVVNDLLHTFIGASLFTLKRVLGEEALKKFDEDKNDPGNLAQWYARTVIRLSGSHVDFGLELRNRADFDFHFKFAQKIASDRVKWEVLNRYHRYLNTVSKLR
jgi:hypothetical protein